MGPTYYERNPTVCKPPLASESAKPRRGIHVQIDDRAPRRGEWDTGEEKHFLVVVVAAGNAQMGYKCWRLTQIRRLCDLVRKGDGMGVL
jgi:hypothetical protein